MERVTMMSLICLLSTVLKLENITVGLGDRAKISYPSFF